MKHIIKKYLNEIINEQRKPKGYWDDETNLKRAAEDSKSLTDFQKKYQTAYNKSRKKGKEFFNRITSHMEKPKSVTPYSDEELIKIASKYKHKKDFIEHDNGAYQVALKRGKEFYDKITSNMLPIGSKQKRMVYAYFFTQLNAVYVGLTFNINIRNKQHLIVDDNKSQTSVGKFIKEFKEKPKLVELTKYIDVKDAQIKENEYVDKFTQEGFLILNKVKTGGLGGGYKYSEEELKDITKQINNYKDLYTNYYPIYRAIKKRGKEFQHEVTKHMTTNQINWTEELVIDLANNFQNKTEFQNKYAGAVSFAKRNNFWDELFKKDEPSEIEIIKIASEFNTQNDFRMSHPSLYNDAKKLGILSKIKFKNSKKRGPSLKPEDIILIAQKYNTLTDFYTNENSVYRRAKIFCKTLGDEFCDRVFQHLK